MRRISWPILTAVVVALAAVLYWFVVERNRPEGTGDSHGKRMLVAFAGDRNYEEALREAQLICDHFPRSHFHECAKGLAEQLPRRMDDFKTLKLPTHTEWEDLKTKLTREQQIDYLCMRMRLFNSSDPTPFWSFKWPQYAEPPGMTLDADEFLTRGKTYVINPVQQLAGNINGAWGDVPKPFGMQLKISEIPLLTPYLRDDWYMLIVTYTRHFHVDRYLARSREMIAIIIDDMARKDLCRDFSKKNPTPAEMDSEIERINQWAAANAQKTVAEIEWDALQEYAAKGAPWNVAVVVGSNREVKERVETLLELKETRVYEVMKHYLVSGSTPNWCKPNILSLYLKHDWTRAKDLAPMLLESSDQSIRFKAALIVSRNGDTARARGVIREALEYLNTEQWPIEVWEILLNDGADVPRQHLVRLLSSGDRIPPEMLSRCAARGMKEPYQYYLALLNNNDKWAYRVNEEGNRIGTFNCTRPVSLVFAEEIIEKFAPKDPAVKEIAAKHPKTADQIPHLKKWLQSRIAAE